MYSRGIFFSLPNFRWSFCVSTVASNKTIKTQKAQTKTQHHLPSGCPPLLSCTSSLLFSLPLLLSPRRAVCMIRQVTKLLHQEKNRRKKNINNPFDQKNALRYEWNTVIFPSEALQRCNKKISKKWFWMTKEEWKKCVGKKCTCCFFSRSFFSCSCGSWL